MRSNYNTFNYWYNMLKSWNYVINCNKINKLNELLDIYAIILYY